MAGSRTVACAEVSATPTRAGATLKPAMSCPDVMTATRSGERSPVAVTFTWLAVMASGPASPDTVTWPESMSSAVLVLAGTDSSRVPEHGLAASHTYSMVSTRVALSRWVTFFGAWPDQVRWPVSVTWSLLAFMIVREPGGAFSRTAEISLAVRSTACASSCWAGGLPVLTRFIRVNEITTMAATPMTDTTAAAARRR